MTGEQSILKDFQGKPFVQLHPGCAQQRSNRFGRPPLPPNYLAQIFGMHPQLQDSNLRPVDRLHLHVLGMINEGSGNGFDQFLHRVPGIGAPGETGDTQISGRR
jgi:hypothetical protein